MLQREATAEGRQRLLTRAAEFELAVQFLEVVLWALDAQLLPPSDTYNAADLAAECARRREDRTAASAATRTRVMNMRSYPVPGSNEDGRLFVDELCAMLDSELQLEGTISYPPADFSSVVDLYRCGSPANIKDKHTLVWTLHPFVSVLMVDIWASC